MVANILYAIKAKCHGQLLNLRQGLQEFGAEGVAGAKAELSQMHDRAGFRAIAVAELTRRERKRAQEGLMLLTRKKKW